MGAGHLLDFRIKTLLILAKFSDKDNSFSVLQHTIIGCIQRLKLCAVPILIEQFLHIIKMQCTVFVFCRQQTQYILKHKILGSVFPQEFCIVLIQIIPLISHHFGFRPGSSSQGICLTRWATDN